MKVEGEEPPFVSMMSAVEPVHSGRNTASDVRVMTDETPRVRTPFEGRVKGVQCGRVVVAEVVGLARLMSCRASILNYRGPAAVLY